MINWPNFWKHILKQKYESFILSVHNCCTHLLKVKITQSCLTICDPLDHTVHGVLQARTLEWAAFPSPLDLPNPGIKPRSLALQAESLPAEPEGKPKNTGVGSLSLRQWIFLTQESNRGLLHYRRILYQRSYEGSPCMIKKPSKSGHWLLVSAQHLLPSLLEMAPQFSFLGTHPLQLLFL